MPIRSRAVCLAGVQTRAPLADLDETALGSLLGQGSQAAKYRVAKVAIAQERAVVSLAEARGRALELLLARRDDAVPCAHRTRHFNVSVLREGTLPREEDRALKAFVAHLRSRERVLKETPRLIDVARPPIAEASAIRLATEAILVELGRWGEVPARQRVWSTFVAWVLQSRVSQRQAKAAALGAMAYDLALSLRGNAWRVGITLNPRALPDLAQRTLCLLRETTLDHGAGARALARVERPGLFLTVGCVLAGDQAKVKIYAQETTHGEEPLDAAELQRFFGRLPRGAPRRCAVVCLDLYPSGRTATKLYVATLPVGLRGAARRRVEDFVATSQRLGGFPYVTVRFEKGRSRYAVNAVFSTHRSALRRGAWEWVLAQVGASPFWDRLGHLRDLARRKGADLAVTALGADIDGQELDVYVVPT